MNENVKAVVVPTVVGVATGALGFAAGWYLRGRRTDETIQDEDYIVEDGAGNETVITAKEIRERRKEVPKVLQDILERSEEEAPEQQGFVIPADEYENIVKNPRRDPSEIVTGIPNEVGEPETVTENVFDGVDNSVPDWDWDEEKAHREAIPYDQPYILHRDEFFDEETHYGQTTLTYYSVDKKLTDERDAPLYNQGDVVGDCLRFGHGSGDPHVVYIRNNKLHAEYEVLLHESSYDVEVLGLDAEEELDNELKHSMDRPLKFRQE